MRTFVVFVVLLFVSVSGVNGQVPQEEREALIALYNSTDGDNWYWVKTTGPGSCEEAAVVLVPGSVLFLDGFESGNPWGWSWVVGMAP